MEHENIETYKYLYTFNIRKNLTICFIISWNELLKLFTKSHKRL